MSKIEVAEPKDRFVAAAIDFVPPFILFLIAAPFSSGWAALLAIGGSVYLIFRDVVGNGQSLGKKIANLHVVDSETDRVPDPMALILRNLGFGIPGLNVIYALVEGIQVVRHPQGLRYGDMFANTGVVKVPSEDREKLLAPMSDRPSRTSNPRIKNPDYDPTAATEADAPPVASPAASMANRRVADPTAGTEPGDMPPSTPARRVPTPIDLPPEKPAAPKAAVPAAAPRQVTSAPKPNPGAAPAGAPRPMPSGPKPAAPGSVPAAAPRPVPSAPKPAAPAAPAARPAAPPAPAARPAAPAAKHAAPAAKPAAPAQGGVKMDDDDPLKKLVDQAAGVPPKR